MFNKFDLDKIINELDEKSIIYEGTNNVVILKTKRNIYSLQKEDVDSLKLYFEVSEKKYDIIPFEYSKYLKILEKYANGNDIWLFQTWTIGPDWTYSPFDFKSNKIDWKYYAPELLDAAKRFKYNVHLNEKPNSWTQYSNNLYD